MAQLKLSEILAENYMNMSKVRKSNLSRCIPNEGGGYTIFTSIIVVRRRIWVKLNMHSFCLRKFY